MTRLLVRDCGAGTSIQDAGRFGYQRYGVGPAGAMDRVALAVANRLVGNEPGTGAIEFTLFGGSFEVEGGEVRVALAGAMADLKLDGEPVPALSSVTARAGQVISVGPARLGVFMMLAVSGGFDLQPDLGSQSFHLRAGLGGVGREPVKPGQRLPVAGAPGGPELTVTVPPRVNAGAYRVVLGPQDDYFSAAGLRALTSEAYVISAQADRMGYRLSGPKIEHSKGFNIVSDGIATGSIQVPGSGEPIVLLADGGTTGGYPKIATIISADLPRFVQQRPGSEVRFTAISRDQAIAAARDQAAMLAAVAAGLQPVGGGLDAERLLSLNLVDGWVDAHETASMQHDIQT
ncbi:biotin-dependent carboxyltransferase family protein [Phreatobacter stygius]|uniref:Biotin-dependent carboxyltransferase family protein n=1 Tax=Phreatobacter stygius TaxID=1940610 RepID=A0A4D7AXM3_9HYPH|nr:biotin-dependent carboxyltransferase family protein [Phreatobacter stygius]QCI63663.1 biotin-dependent carboxyltransferase family protein [Phreatobacter stygius]